VAPAVTQNQTCHKTSTANLDEVAPNAITSILLVIAGLLLVFGVHAGIDVLVPAR
jgi:hypothetical protein